MDTTIVGVTFAAAALAYVFISNARAHAAARQREAEFFARHLRAGRRIPGRFLLLTHDR